MSVPVQNMTGKRPNNDLDVLVVDDDHPIRNLVGHIVDRLEVTSREARDGQEAIEEMERKSPDILILDLMMPRVSGWQVLDWMGERDLFGVVSVVVLTAVGSKKMAGLADYPIRAIIDKPFEITHLSRTLQTIVDEVR